MKTVIRIEEHGGIRIIRFDDEGNCYTVKNLEFELLASKGTEAFSLPTAQLQSDEIVIDNRRTHI